VEIITNMRVSEALKLWQLTFFPSVMSGHDDVGVRHRPLQPAWISFPMSSPFLTSDKLKILCTYG
jgi:hypothetical protein